MREETIIDTEEAARAGATRDEGAKRLFSNKEIVAPILRLVVPEFNGLTTEDAMRCIEGEIQSSAIPVNDIGLRIRGDETELSSTTEKALRFDKSFKARNPLYKDGSKLSMYLHVDMEMQDRYYPSNPSYPLTKRAVYYGARALARQLGTATEVTDYSALEKCYSIWICNNVTAKTLRNSVTEYAITRKDVAGECREPEAYHDLITIIMIRLGDGMGAEGIFDYLDSVFSADFERMKKYSDVQWGEELKAEESKMISSYTYGLFKGELKGEERGIKLGEERGLKIGEERGLKIGEERGLKLGEERGLKIGEERFGKLVKILLANGDLDSISKASEDAGARLALLEEYGLLDADSPK